MPKETFFTSDTHFGHDNIRRYSMRPFTSVEEMDEILIENWNRTIRPGDDVYFLGDFAYRNKADALSIRNRLHGNIFFIEGNHDSAAHQIRKTFVWYREVKRISVGEQEIFLSHYAHRVWNKSHHGVWHLYGHSHHSLPDDPNMRCFDVGVDSAAMMFHPVHSDKWGQGTTHAGVLPKDYRPLHFDEVAAIMAKKTFKPVDHHGWATS